MSRPRFWGLHARPGRGFAFFLATLPFIVALILYSYHSYQRHQENPRDKLLPTASQMADTMRRYAFEEDKRSGARLLWKDTKSSLKRLLIGVGLAAILAVWLGLNMGLFYGMSSTLSAFITFISMIPPIAVLPVLFIAFGIGEFGKIALIFIGTFPLMTRDIYLSTRQLPREQVTKALTLGASSWAVVYHVTLPQVLPRAIESLRLSLGAAWLFLIAAEAIASTDGLGYRIFLVRRYLSMDVILPYVMWITFLGFTMDFALRTLRTRLFPWYRAA